MQKLPFEILFEDDEMVAINKPGGMLTLPDRHDAELQSVRGILQTIYGKIFVVHRIDKDTSGVLIFAKNETTHKYLSELFTNRNIVKTYVGLVHTKPQPAEGSIVAPIAEHFANNGTMMVHHKGKHSHTDYKLIEELGKISLVEFVIHTGRTHQIRVHCKHIGHPIVCDPLYGDGKPVLLSSFKKKFKLSKEEEDEKPIMARLALHAQKLAFTNMDGKEIVIEAPFFKDMKVLITQLQKVKN